MNWDRGWRERTWSSLDRDWDLIIIGGGITGAGIFRQAADAGLQALLLEAADFASGTSSRSSKLVHGGLRYLRTAQLRLTVESVREREYLLDQGRGLVTPLGFLYARLRGDHMPGWIFGLGLCAYDIMARQWLHRSYDALDMRELCPPLSSPRLRGGYRYFDAQTDDARLVFRLIREAVSMGGVALNYARVMDLARTRDGGVRGVAVEDRSGSDLPSRELRAKTVINAAGVWVDQLRSHLSRPPRMRPLRGSHLLLPAQRLPLTRAVTFLHPQDGRPVFALPWEGVILFGTTDLDHSQALELDPRISEIETAYLLTALQDVFPAQELTHKDILSTFSGLRPVVNTGKSDPSKESREYAVWDENGLITVAGGKLTTFRLMARDALSKASRYLDAGRFNHSRRTLTEPELFSQDGSTLAPSRLQRLSARYSGEVLARILEGQESDQAPIPGTPYSWGELRAAAGQEAVVHLDDLLLRRLRIGLLLPEGGKALLERMGAIIRPELGWRQERWSAESARYLELIRGSYQPPATGIRSGSIPAARGEHIQG